MSREDESFFREVEEDYQREQILKLLQRYGSYIIGAAFVIVAVVAGYTIEKRKSAAEAARGGDAFTKAISLLDTGKQEEAQKALSDIVDNGPPVYKVLARLSLAADALAKKQPENALTLYRGVADDAAAPSDLRDFARLQIAALKVDTESYDKLSAELERYRSGTSPWRYSAKELLGLAAYKEGKTAEAEKLFAEIQSDGGAPQGMRQRAEIMLGLILEKPKAKPSESKAKGDTASDAKTQ